jgi:5S rRNA maturation endonuclease (ribonuclease M5)
LSDGNRIDKEEVLDYFKGQFHVFYKKFVSLKGKTGGIIKIASPFRSETKPSFQICLSGEFEGRWHDFGTGEDGDIFDFYAKIYGSSITFDGVVTKVCEEFSISPAPIGQAKKKLREKIQPIQQALSKKPKEYEAGWTIPFTDALLKNTDKSLDYIKSRGITEESVIKFRLGSSETKIGNETLPCIVIPFFSTDRTKVSLVKKRTFPDKNYIREAGMSSCLFNEDAIASTEDLSIVYICEGEFDAIVLWQCGFENVISGTTGAGSFQTDWVNKLEKFKTIVIAYDADTAGESGSADLAKRLGEDRVRIVKLPEGMKDINEAYLAIGKERLTQIINSAQPVPIPHVTSLFDAGALLVNSLLDNNNMPDGFTWPWDNVTNKIGRIIPGRLIELSGPPSMGKTTLGIQVAAHLAGNESIPSLVCCFEMTPSDLTKFIIQQVSSIEEYDITADNVSSCLEYCAMWPLFFQFHDEIVNIESVIETITEAYKRFGIKFVVIDNLHLLARAADDELKEQGKISRYLKLWAVRYNVSVMLIVHPRKFQEGRMEALSDVRGNAAVTADADTVLTIWRQNLQPKSEEDLVGSIDMPLYHPATCLLQNKGRFVSGSGKVWLYNEGQFRRFRKLRNEDELPSIKKEPRKNKIS